MAHWVPIPAAIRIPCSYTGLVGLRPAFRRSQLNGVAPLSPSKDTVGPMVHSVEDAALLHAVIHGLPPVALPVRSLKGVRFGVVTALQGEDEVQLEVWQSALHTLRRAGATLVEVSLPFLEEVRQATCLSLYEFRVAIDDWLSKQPGAPSGLTSIVDSGAFLPEFAPFLRQMLASNTLKTPLWLAGRRFSACCGRTFARWRRRSASTDLCIPPYNDYQKVWRRCRQAARQNWPLSAACLPLRYRAA
ncbi:amidase family protein [Enterobacter hormaechei]